MRIHGLLPALSNDNYKTDLRIGSEEEIWARDSVESRAFVFDGNANKDSTNAIRSYMTTMNYGEQAFIGHYFGVSVYV